MILKRGGQAADMMVVAENLDAFDGLRSELEAEFPDGGWAAVTAKGLRKALDAQPPAYVLMAVDATDLGRLDELVQLVSLGRARGASPSRLLATRGAIGAFCTPSAPQTAQDTMPAAASVS